MRDGGKLREDEGIRERIRIIIPCCVPGKHTRRAPLHGEPAEIFHDVLTDSASLFLPCCCQECLLVIAFCFLVFLFNSSANFHWKCLKNLIRIVDHLF